MLNQLQQLQHKSRDELEGIANRLGLVTKPAEKDSEICDRIAIITSQILPSRGETMGEEYLPDVGDFTRKELNVALSGHIKAGLKVKIDDDGFMFSYGKKSDSGTLKQPLKVILRCASALVQPV